MKAGIVARKITHKNVCRMYDFHEEGTRLFLTMEYVRGEDLKGLMHQTKGLSVGTALSYAKQIAEGLAEAHKLGVVHRDLKPGNIMVDKDGQAKVMDFGIARTLAGEGMTSDGAFIGTPEYMSPEQVEGKQADARSDIYSLGVILFEMVVGRPPFEGETAFSIANKHKTEPAPVPKKLVPQPIVRKAAQKTDFGVIYYGSTSPAMSEALGALEQQGVYLDRMRVRAFPFPQSVRKFVMEHETVFIVEQNRDGQLRLLLVNELELDPARLVPILHYDGTPITARFIVKEIGDRVQANNVRPLKSGKAA